MTNRIEQLRIMLEKDPNDPFLLYGIGMEYKKQGDFASAIEYFRRAIAADGGYCYAYYQMGQVYEAAGDVNAARGAYAEGIAAARKVGDGHAESEIAGALAGWGG